MQGRQRRLLMGGNGARLRTLRSKQCGSENNESGEEARDAHQTHDEGYDAAGRRMAPRLSFGVSVPWTLKLIGRRVEYTIQATAHNLVGDLEFHGH